VTLIAVLLGGTLDDPDYLARSANMNAKTKDPYNAQRFEDAIALFDYGFKQMSQIITIQELIDMGMPVSFPVQVQNASKNDPENGQLTVSPRLDVNQQMQLMTPFMEQLKEVVTTMAETKIGTLVAPINSGDVVGTVEYKVGNSILFTSNLYADRDVKEGILSSEPAISSEQPQPQVSAGAVTLMGTASTLSGEPVKESNAKRTILIVVLVLLALLVVAFAAFMIVVRIRRERRRKAKAAARRRRKMQQERIARQRAAERDRT
jgi:hypothetical protein